MPMPAPRRPSSPESDREKERWLEVAGQVWDLLRDGSRGHVTLANLMVQTNQGGSLLIRLAGPSRAVPEAIYIAEGFGGMGDLGYRVNG